MCCNYALENQRDTDFKGVLLTFIENSNWTIWIILNS